MYFSLASTNANEPFGIPMEARFIRTKSPACIFHLVLHFAIIAFLAVVSSGATILVTLEHSKSYHVPSLLCSDGSRY